jgi:hypothetical protein
MAMYTMLTTVCASVEEVVIAIIAMLSPLPMRKGNGMA